METTANISEEEISAFLKTIIEIGNGYKVDDEYNIRKRNDKRMMLKMETRTGVDSVPVKIINPEMKREEYDHLILNPFVEDVTVGNEKTWFWTLLRVLLTKLVKETVGSICTHLIEGEKEEDADNLIAAKLLEPFVSLVDDKTWNEKLSKIEEKDWLVLCYDPKMKRAYLKSPVMDEEYRKSLKLRKMDWTFVDKFFEQLDMDDLTVWEFKSSNPGMMEIEAKMNIFVTALEKLNDYATYLLNTDLHIPDLQYGLAHLMEYHKACRFRSSSAYKRIQEKQSKEEKPSDKPWNISTIPNQSAAPQPGSSIPGNVAPEWAVSSPPNISRNMFGNQPVNPFVSQSNMFSAPPNMGGNVFGNQPVNPFASQSNMFSGGPTLPGLSQV